jgi:hypothetical protein
LPVFSVADKREARTLLTIACSTTISGDFIAEELAEEQDLNNLEAFSARLDLVHDYLIGKGHCRCYDQHRTVDQPVPPPSPHIRRLS